MRPDLTALLFATAVAALSACSSSEPVETAHIPPVQPAESAPAAPPVQPQSAPPPSPRIVRGAPGLQCVPYARQRSGIRIRGNAWTWWRKAEGRYERSNRPSVGSILVVSRTARNRYGHLAVVTRIINEREIVVNHANWLNKGQIHLDVPVRDVSERNDWSVVRFWYTPANVMGRSTYPVSGFIHPPGRVARTE
jgi:surface antigen